MIALLLVFAGSAYEAGIKMMEANQPAAAAARFEEAVREDPKFAQAWKALGVARAMQQDYPLAEPAFAEACRLAPRLADACFYHGRSLYLLNRFERALALLGPIGETDARVHRLIALSLEGLGRWTEAESAYRKAVARQGSVIPAEDARIDYAAALNRQGRAAEVGLLLDPLATAAPGVARVHLELGRALVQLDRLDQGRAALERAVQLDPANAAARMLLGRTLLRLGRGAEARPHLDAAARLAR